MADVVFVHSFVVTGEVIVVTGLIPQVYHNPIITDSVAIIIFITSLSSGWWTASFFTVPVIMITECLLTTDTLGTLTDLHMVPSPAPPGTIHSPVTTVVSLSTLTLSTIV